MAVSHYEVRKKESSSGVWDAEINAGLVLTYQFTGLDAATAYDFQVRAVDAASNASAWSNIESGTTDAPPYDPATITDMEFYFEADFQALANDAAFTQMTDQTANAAHATQGTGGNQGVCKTGIINGLPVIRLDGSNDFYNLSLPSMSEFTMAAVKKVTGGSGILVHGSDGTNDYWQATASDFDQMRLDGVDKAVGTDSSEFELHVWTFSAGSLKFYRDGSLVSTDSRTMTAFDPAYLFCYNGSSDFVAGDVALLAIASRDITGADLTAFHSFAMTKYGL